MDVWGVGVILFTLLLGNTPWDEPTINSPEFCRYESGTVFTEQPWQRLSTLVLGLIRGMLTVDPTHRMTLDDVQAHPWVMRSSQLTSQSVIKLAEKLTEPLRTTGDLDLANPILQTNLAQGEDEPVSSTDCRSQFTQSLMLFSQTQSGSRYTPHLTRFYTSIGPSLLFDMILETLVVFNVQCKATSSSIGGSATEYRLRIGGHDRRQMIFKGWVIIEKFIYKDSQVEGSFVVMKRDEGNPISWRQLWKAVVESETVGPHVLRK